MTELETLTYIGPTNSNTAGSHLGAVAKAQQLKLTTWVRGTATGAGHFKRQAIVGTAFLLLASNLGACGAGFLTQVPHLLTWSVIEPNFRQRGSPMSWFILVSAVLGWTAGILGWWRYFSMLAAQKRLRATVKALSDEFYEEQTGMQIAEGGFGSWGALQS